MIKEEFVEYLRALDVVVRPEEPMSLHTSFRIGGAVDCFCEVPTLEALKKVLKRCREEAIPYRVIGLGSNLLVDDEGLSGIVIKLTGDFDAIEPVGETSLRCGAGVSLAGACIAAKNRSLSGLEFAWGIPGSVGGAVYMNAGAYGGEMKDVVVSSRYLDENGEVGELVGADHAFTYRRSAYTDSPRIILDVTLQLTPGSKNEIFFRMQENMDKRKNKQPTNRPSAGSVFKRPQGYYAAALIEECGLKGKTMGGAQVSEKHSGFIVNNGGATARDVKELVEYVRRTVLEKTGVTLECEIKFWPEG